MWTLLESVIRLATTLAENSAKDASVSTISDEQLELERKISSAQRALDRTLGRPGQGLSSISRFDRPLPEPADSDRAIVDSAHSEIDDASKHIKEGKPELAIEQLERIHRARWDRLSARERYRLLANLGNAKLALGKQSDAARYYVRAAEHQPTDEEARALEAIAHYLLGQNEHAFTLASALCEAHPTFPRGHMIRLRTTAKDAPYPDLLETVPITLRSDPEVALALHDRAAAEEDYVAAEQALRACDLEHIDWAPLLLALGATILQQEHLALLHLGQFTEARLRDAEALFTSSLLLLPRPDPDQLAFAAHLNRGLCRKMLGSISEARADLLAAKEANPSDVRVVIPLALSYFPDGNKLDQAIELVERCLGSSQSSEIEVLYGIYLYHRRHADDLTTAESLLAKHISNLDALDMLQRFDLIETLTAIILIKGDGEAALGLLRAIPSGSINTAFYQNHLAEIYRQLGRTNEAIEAARKALTAIDFETPTVQVISIAKTLAALDLNVEAFTLLQSRAKSDQLSPITRPLLRAARESGKHEFIKLFCSQLRAQDVFDPGVLEIEIATLLQYHEYSLARVAFESYLAAFPDDRLMWLNFTALAIQRGWSEVVSSGLARLPPAHEVDRAEVGALASDILRVGPEPLSAVDYAYALYKRFPDSRETQAALIKSVIPPGPRNLGITKPESAGPGTAVCYRDSSSTERWVVIDDGPNLSKDRNEYSPDEGLGALLVDRTIGESIVFPSHFIDVRQIEIVDIVDSRVFRAHRLAETWSERFPDEPFIEPIKMDSGTDSGLYRVAELLRRHAESVEEVERLYIERKLPIASVAAFCNCTVLEALHRISTGRAKIYAAPGDKEQFERARESLTNARAVVLGPAAFGTLVLLNRLDILAMLPIEILVLESTLDEVLSLLESETLSGDSSGYLSYVSGRLVVRRSDAESMAGERQNLVSGLSTARQACSVIGGGDLMSLEQSMNEFTKIVTPSSLEAVAAAVKRDVPLWSDDQVGYELFFGKFAFERVWTQAVLSWAADHSYMNKNDVNSLTAHLLRLGYQFTSISPLMVFDVCEQALWQVVDPNLAAVLAEFADPAWSTDLAIAVVLSTLAGIWRQAPAAEHASDITRRLLTHLRTRTDFGVILARIQAARDSIIGLAITRQQDFAEIIQSFKRYGVPSF